jgi:hypothetical protein
VLDDEKMIYIMDVDASRALFMMSIALQVHVGISCIGLVWFLYLLEPRIQHVIAIL